MVFRSPCAASRRTEVFLSAFVLTVLLLGLPACSSQGAQDEFADRAGAPSSGITQTDPFGNVRKGSDGKELLDPDDWQTAPAFRGDVTVNPAYPNPSDNEPIAVGVLIRFGNSVRGGLYLSGRRADGRLFSIEARPEASGAGLYVFQFSPTVFPSSGVYRLFVFDGSGEIVSYGDVQVL